MTTSEPASASVSLARFYARQTRLLGTGDVEGWSETFAEDAVYEQRGRSDRVYARGASPARRGRDQIASAARGALADLAERGAVRKQWIDLVDVDTGPDGTVRAEYRTVIVQTGRDGGTSLHISAYGADVVVPDGERWLVTERVLWHDDA
ncbi:hypothetical protein ED92_40110 [Amycolatopsis sp. MJM2582]|uniref:nuclear transport factor 2 family protein n=1 Tax=Amycolatopsis TaxID=1813 RepID=UPI00050368F2|nr:MULTISPECIES: nuclear transport factor 2 family protein [unclassified Amycolatopsis]KFZ76896.1 hypothetical protein ED92_40110 [Amycolatopsis sp. MJM2582]RSN39551.1 hypothetical protein DMC64_38230 [Amycolatopsis sp. WAC 04197]